MTSNLRSRDEIASELRAKFEKLYSDSFLFAPKYIHEVLYIDSQLSLAESSEVLSLSQLCDKVLEKLVRSFLILGDSGSGKTSFAFKLCEILWGRPESDDKLIIPFYIFLPALVAILDQTTANSDFDIVKLIVKELGVSGIEEWEGQIIFVLDSFDELSSFCYRTEIIQNIWIKTSSWVADVSVITCSRPEAVPKSKRQEMFEFVKFGHVRHVSNRKYLEYDLVSLSQDTISSFLGKMDTQIIPRLRNRDDNDLELRIWPAWQALKVRINDWKPGDYERWFHDLPDLKRLSENPYVLTLICQVLPAIVLKFQNEAKMLKKLCKTRVGIFSAFVDQIFEYQAERVTQRLKLLKPGAKNILYTDWLLYFKAYAQNLAAKMIRSGNTDQEQLIRMSDKETLDPSLVEPVLNIKLLEKLEKDYKDLFPPRLTDYENLTGRQEGVADPIPIENMRILRDACNGSILTYSANDNEYRFIHRSMLEYFASQEAFDSSLAEFDLIVSQHLDDASVIYGRTGFGRTLIQDRDILAQLVERMSFEYKEILFELIKVSKRDSKLHRISANAITVLNKAFVSFSGQDYSDIQIQGADLRQAICANTNFSGANLSGVRFGQCCLAGAQFQGACFEDTDFGELPFLKLSSPLNSVFCFSDQNNSHDSWVVATADGVVKIWNTLEARLLIPKCQSPDRRMETCVSLLNDRIAVWTQLNSIYKTIQLSTKMVRYEVSILGLLPEYEIINKLSIETTDGVDQIYILFSSEDKCVFVYSTCHMEVLPYLPKTNDSFPSIITIGDGNPESILTFAAIVDKVRDLLVACFENCPDGITGRLAVYKYDSDSNEFYLFHITESPRFEITEEKYKLNDKVKITFKHDGSSLAFYTAAVGIQVFENYYEIIRLVRSNIFFNLTVVFNKAGQFLAGLDDAANIIIIWNIPLGTIYRRFVILPTIYSLSASNLLAFSNDSKFLAYGESESSTMKLIFVDEDPFIENFADTNIDISNLSVSDDGQLIVVNACTNPYKPSLEIFSFPFKSNTGLVVVLPIDDYLDSTSIGVFNSKSDDYGKKVVVIHKRYCRALVVCPSTGEMFQDFRFYDSDTDDDSKRVCCINSQTSLCCIYFQDRRCLFWKIHENDNFEILLKKIPELDLLLKIELYSPEFRFDYSGRYLQIVSRSKLQSEFGNIVLFDTNVTDATKEIVSYDRRCSTGAKDSDKFELCLHCTYMVYSMDTDMVSCLIFTCSYNKLQIFNQIDKSLVQELYYNFYYPTSLHFEPLSQFIFAACGLRNGLVIFHRKESEWKLALEIPLWFDIRALTTFNYKEDIVSVFVGGRGGNVCYFEFEKDDCQSWKLLWSNKPCTRLSSLKCNFDGALQLEKQNAVVLEQIGGTGSSCQNLKIQYLPFSDWCQEIFGTARSKFSSPFIKTEGNNFCLSENMWVVSLVGNLSKILEWRAHVYFIVEGIKNNRRFITSIHLIYSERLKEASILVSPLVDSTPINDHSWEESKYVDFVDLAGRLSAQQYGMPKEVCEIFLRNIQSDMQRKLDYNVWTNNCGVWCEDHLKKVGHEVSLEGFTAALIFPRVLKLLKQLWKKPEKSQ